MGTNLTRFFLASLNKLTKFVIFYRAKTKDTLPMLPCFTGLSEVEDLGLHSKYSHWPTIATSSQVFQADWRNFGPLYSPIIFGRNGIELFIPIQMVHIPPMYQERLIGNMWTFGQDNFLRIFWNNMGFEIIFPVRKILLFKRSIRPLYVARFLRQLIDYIHRKKFNLRSS